MRWIGVVWISLVTVPVSFSYAQSIHERACVQLYKQKKYRRAARCFQRLADLQDRQKKKFYRGRLLRNASLLLIKAAQIAPLAVAQQHRHQAMKLLEIYLKEQLCEVQERCIQVRRMLSKLRLRAGYARLTVSVRPSSARIWVKGKVVYQGVGRWSQVMAPRTYVVRVSAPGWKEQNRKIWLAPNKSQSIRIILKRPKKIIPSKPKRSVTIVPWIVAGTGVVAGVVGAVFVGLSFSTNEKAVQNWNLLDTAQPHTISPQEAQGYLNLFLCSLFFRCSNSHSVQQNRKDRVKDRRSFHCNHHLCYCRKSLELVVLHQRKPPIRR